MLKAHIRHEREKKMMYDYKYNSAEHTKIYIWSEKEPDTGMIYSDSNREI